MALLQTNGFHQTGGSNHTHSQGQRRHSALPSSAAEGLLWLHLLFTSLENFFIVTTVNHGDGTLEALSGAVEINGIFISGWKQSKTSKCTCWDCSLPGCRIGAVPCTLLWINASASAGFSTEVPAARAHRNSRCQPILL